MAASLIFASLAPALWAGNFVVARAIHQSLPPLTLNLFRWLIALIVLSPLFARSLWSCRRELRHGLPHLFVLAATGVVGFNSVLYIAVHYTTATSASVLFSITPIFICIINSIVARKKPSALQIAAAIVSVAGALIVLRVRLDSSSLWTSGDLLVLLAALIWAAYCVAIKRSSINASGGAILLASVVLGVTIQLPLSIFELANDGIPTLDGRDIAAVVYLGAGAAALGFLVWQRAVSGLGPEKCGVFLNLIPVFGSVLAVAFLHERFSSRLEMGAPVVAFGLVLAQLDQKALAFVSAFAAARRIARAVRYCLGAVLAAASGPAAAAIYFDGSRLPVIRFLSSALRPELAALTWVVCTGCAVGAIVFPDTIFGWRKRSTEAVQAGTWEAYSPPSAPLPTRSVCGLFDDGIN